MTCKHGFPEPNEMMWQGKKILRCNECEIERLRQRVAELEEENRKLKRTSFFTNDEVEQIEKDAKRLQWIIENGATTYGELVHRLSQRGFPSHQEIKAAIDAAMEEGEPL